MESGREWANPTAFPFPHLPLVLPPFGWTKPETRGQEDPWILSIQEPLQAQGRVEKGGDSERQVEDIQQKGQRGDRITT